MPKTEAEAEKRVAIRAARRLKEAETYELTRPTEKLLARNLGLLENCRSVSTHATRCTITASLDAIRASAAAIRCTTATLGKRDDCAQNPGINDGEDAASAEQRLSLTVTKQDFLEMRVLGQFNKGFILTARGNELFIIDQHASDEKYNFETLQATTTVQHQPLVAPRTLELMAMDEVAVADNLGVLRRNGFVVAVDADAPTGRRCALVSLPMSRETVFGVADLEELVHLIHQTRGAGTAHLRCSKVRAMFAMRACRRSVMVGRALPAPAMERIVRHMAELDKPWNCPHGRPTMRHLAELAFVDRWTERGGGGALRWAGAGWADTWDMYKDGRRYLALGEAPLAGLAQVPLFDDGGCADGADDEEEHGVGYSFGK